MFALSTSWNSWKHHHAQDIINEIKPLGFTQVELNFSLSESLVQEMGELQKKGLISIVSVHNFCPIPLGISRKEASPDSPSLSSTDEQERALAVKFTKRTIDTALRLGAACVVLHTGRVRMREKIRELAALKNNSEERKFTALKNRLIKERSAKSPRFFNQVLKSLDELSGYALTHKIKLGIENRFYVSEIPLGQELDLLFARFPSPPVYYWHDVGHAQIFEYLGFSRQETNLEKFAHRLAGIHLHDVQEMSDHRAPLTGAFDFSRLRPYMQRELIKVMEVHHPSTKEEIIRGLDHLKKVFSEVTR
ncbi:MAG: sugar phosphate isomerase/epimerase [Candidatus Omnitrophota bacterium]